MQKETAGFSLIEVLVAGAIMIVMGLSLTTLVMNNNRAVKSVSLSSEFVQLTSNIQSLLNNDSTCVALLGGKSFVASTVASSSGTLPISISPAHSVSPLEFHGLTLAKRDFQNLD